ncbi:MAG: PepSY domain-containing protein [Sphingomonas sp.]|uniref:PepSY-associated TM helix domain-containing protein n=1 Tax=Sphingomonas sp. TaxID=28214 RepID=UPI0012198EA6|nr:PepSY-associated TM helix domain-containing protein [Sphingomonas sp.]THD37331.1 MAG: PepSY domain-containing protein [Sphingomonas sp.]
MTKIGLRNAWFLVHKWIGLSLAVLIIPLCVTGAALVWDEALDHVLNPQRYAVGAGPSLAPDTLAAAAQRAAGTARLATLKLPAEPGAPAIASTGPAPSKTQGPAPRTNVYLDPATGKVLDVANSRSGAVMVMHQIHGTMLIPVWGRPLVGWLGVAMLFSCFTGLWLWWPTVGSWVRGLRWRRHRNLDTNLHHLFGFWIALPLFVLSLTGAWISFPAFFGPLVGENGRAMGFSAERAAMNRAQPLAVVHTPLKSAIDGALALTPGQVTQIGWPTDYKAVWQVAVKPAKGKPATVAVDDTTGRAALAPDVNRGQAGVARLMRQIHDGTGMGIVWQVIIFVGGLLPAILAITGAIMWWRARGWKGELAARKQRKLLTD